MRRLTKILIAVGIGLLLLAVLILTLVIVLRKEEWIVLERSFASLNEQCTADWSGSSDWKRTRCKMPFICAAIKGQSTGYCRLPMSENEGKSCATSVHLCATGLTCDPYLKVCRRLISVGGSCTEQNAFLCETGICGYAATQTLGGEPLGGRHSLSRYCIVKDLPPGAACDRFRHCVTDCLQCVNGVCKPVITPLDQQQMLLEQQQELMLPLSVNGFSTDQEQKGEEENTARNLQQRRPSREERKVADAGQASGQSGRHQPKEVPTEGQGHTTEQAVRRAWEQRAAEVSALLGESLTAEELAAFFAVPRDTDGQPLRDSDGSTENGEEQEALAGQQAYWNAGQQQRLHALQQQQLPLAQGGGAYPVRPQPVLNGSLAKRLARLFAGVSYAFTPEDQQASFAASFGAPIYGFPSATPPPVPSTLNAAALGGMVPQQPAFNSSVFGNAMAAQAMQPPQPDQMAAQLQRLHQQYQQGYSPYDSALEAMEASGGTGGAAESSRVSNGSEEEGGELEGLYFPGVVGAPTNPFQLLAVAGRNPVGVAPPLGLPSFGLQRPRVPTRLPAVVPPLSVPPPNSFPPLGNVPLGGPSVGVSLPAIPVNPTLQTPLSPTPPFSTPVTPIPSLPSRLPTGYKGGCWVDRCCASVGPYYGCQARKREGAPCVGDSPRECEDQHSCVNGECSPWFTSRHASAGDAIVLTDNVDINSVCAPWQRFEYGHAHHASRPHDVMPPQMALPSPLETPNPYGNNLGRDVIKTLRKFSGRCITLDKRSCVTDRECWGIGGFGFCDVRSKRCRTPTYPACLSLVKDLYGCLWQEGRLRETTDDYIVSPILRTSQFLLHEAPVSINHVQSKCIPSVVRRKRVELLKCVKAQGFTLDKIADVPNDWYKE